MKIRYQDIDTEPTVYKKKKKKAFTRYQTTMN